MEAMKMEHVVAAPRSGIVRSIGVSVGDAVFAGHELVVLVPAEVAASAGLAADDVALDEIRPDLAEVLQRPAFGLDENRTAPGERRRRPGQQPGRPSGG